MYSERLRTDCHTSDVFKMILQNELSLCLLSCSSKHAHACNDYYIFPRSKGTKGSVLK